ncbi:MAG TPA: sigma 54-interacting transcriptional regulator [Myxococcales bacterium]|nr:sigma 54-interacting transcriptional regulator [Myxococcales bacterium]
MTTAPARRVTTGLSSRHIGYTPCVRRSPLLVALLLALAAPAHGDAPARRAAVIFLSFDQDVPGLHELVEAVTAGLRQESHAPLDLFVEYTGLDRFSGDEYEKILVSLYQQKYSTRKIDLVVAVGPAALDFIVARKVLPDVPIVSCYVARRFVEAAKAQRPELTAAMPSQNAPKVIELMLSMFPRTKRIHVILGASEYERAQAAAGKRIFASFEGRVELTYLNDLTLAQVEARLAALPDTELALYGSMLRDASGQDFNTNEALQRISRASRGPIFGLVAEDLGDGIVGGYLLSMELSGKAAAELGLRVLKGERASAIPMMVEAGVVPLWDFRELRRFGIRERDLPLGSQIRFREKTLWDVWWREISAGIGLILVESILVAALIAQLRRRKRIERELDAQKTRYRTVADFTHDLEFWRKPDGSFEYISPSCERITGYPVAEVSKDPHILQERILAEDLTAWKEMQGKALAGTQQGPIEIRFRRPDGEVRWLEQIWNPVRFEDGSFGGTRGSIRDVTARKQAELDLKRAYQEIAALKDQLEAENTYYRGKIQSVEGASELIGDSDPMKYLRFRIGQVAPSATTVLIQGETGTGKELVAESIHRLGVRSGKVLVKVNCAALPHALAESELFGHEKGAFTGAQAQRKGRFEVADGATLFLDEIGELPLELQAKLLRVLQDGDFQRVGGDRTLHVDVRIIAATNRDLAREVAAGRFREDLWYRLNVFPITVPPLRQRSEDIPALTHAFVINLCEKMGRAVLELPRAAVQALQAYNWPGNIRELQNVLEQAVLVSDGPTLRLGDVLRSNRPPGNDAGALSSLVDLERDHIVKVLESCNWKLEGGEGAAQILGLKPSTLRSRMAKLGIQRRNP